MTDDTEICQHQWVDEYYGTKCCLCELFYPHGCAPWDDEVRDGFDFGDDSEEWDEYEEDGPLDLEDAFDRSIERAFKRFSQPTFSNDSDQKR